MSCLVMDHSALVGYYLTMLLLGIAPSTGSTFTVVGEQ